MFRRQVCIVGCGSCNAFIKNVHKDRGHIINSSIKLKCPTFEKNVIKHASLVRGTLPSSCTFWRPVTHFLILCTFRRQCSLGSQNVLVRIARYRSPGSLQIKFIFMISHLYCLLIVSLVLQLLSLSPLIDTIVSTNNYVFNLILI